MDCSTQRRVRVLQKTVRRGVAKNQTRISTDKGKSKECKTRLPQRSQQGHQERQWQSGTR